MFTSILLHAQSDIEIGFGVLGSALAVEPIPVAYRSDFSGPVTYPSLYIEGATLLCHHEKWKPRAVVRLQSEGSNSSLDWPKIRILSGGLGATLGYQLTSVISVLGGGTANYQLASTIWATSNDEPLMELSGPWSGRLNVGVRGDFGRWSSEMLIEKSLTSQTGAVVLSREGSPSFQPTYSILNVRLGLKYVLFQSSSDQS